MIPALVAILGAWLWLMRETDWLRIHLAIGETLAEYDRRILRQIEIEYLAEHGETYQEYETRYQAWLVNYYAPKPLPAYAISQVLIDRKAIDPRDRWQAEDEDLRARRNGEMIYQRRHN